MEVIAKEEGLLIKIIWSLLCIFFIILQIVIALICIGFGIACFIMMPWFIKIFGLFPTLLGLGFLREIINDLIEIYNEI
ncbi:TPA_asm: hypothetical protein vir520_00005 [Caudoviricetes sp. vir520]|nr:TPA_asm: hypothetical protein vir520_00005 [Caudoviricetes sp. vir520]